jgi:two-component system response regulator LytT
VCVVGQSCNGLQACADIARLKPDLVLLDVEMPGYLSAEDNYVRLHTLDGERMAGMLERLDSALCRRIHRSHIANLDHVKKLLPWFGGDNLVMMADGTRLTLSHNHRDALREFA